MTRHIVARTTDIPPGGNKVFGVEGRDIVVFPVNGEFFALLNRCPHEGAPLAKAACVARLTSPEPGVYQRSRVGELLGGPCHGRGLMPPGRGEGGGGSWPNPLQTKAPCPGPPQHFPSSHLKEQFNDACHPLSQDRRPRSSGLGGGLARQARTG